MSDIAVKVENLSKIYKLYKKPIDRMKETFSLSRKIYHKDYFALNNLSFEVKRGEVIGIIGTNGSGKSTLLKIITGVLSPNDGTVEVNGKISALLELGAGFNPEYTGIENIYLNATMMGFSNEEIKDKINPILDFADIGEFVYQPVKTYSSGMFVRLAFAVAINIDPDILIIDEALAVGDSKFQSKCFEKFNEFKKSGKTILLVTHDIGSVKRFCDRVVWLENGYEKGIGNAKEMASKYLADMYSEGDSIRKADEGIKKAEINYKNTDFKPISRWGSNVGLIKYVSLNDKYLIDGIDIEFREKCKIDAIIEIKEEIKKKQNLFFSISIKDLKGQDIVFMTTDKYILNQAEGDTFKISFEFLNTLTPGKYFITICVEDRDDYDFLKGPSYLDYIDGAIYFEVKSDNKKHYGILSIEYKSYIEIVQ